MNSRRSIEDGRHDAYAEITSGVAVGETVPAS
jgi:hypothetical protein